RRHIMDGKVRGRGRAAGGELFKNNGGIEPRETDAAGAFRNIETAESERAGFGDDVLGKDAVAIPARRMRGEFVAREGAGGLLKGELVLVQGEIHVAAPGGKFSFAIINA